MDLPVMTSIIRPSLVLTILAAVAIFSLRMSVITALLISAGLGVAGTFAAA
ncbi:hypothetical protein G6L32_25300 [Agrobacterium tumefaciens]|uniref:hypothetical protein n=1 Tax=Agrobacterium TaxID=357 RepID=UPI0015738D79|nr:MULTISPECIES: hypothetical protein [unclassified Agrobacterium]MBO9112000.1 hypothetical protein [Agrobacterium sp. S2/73]NTA61952.1 hypothetical protein [Agrobacterium tumefaciens]QXZ76356.1 hypothetical protein J5276_25740 [Agrobacterium sp. S7/73]